MEGDARLWKKLEICTHNFEIGKITIKNIRNYFRQYFQDKMHKQVILIVDNRADQELVAQPPKNEFKGSGFKATQIDPMDHVQMYSNGLDEHSLIAQLQDKIVALEKRVNELEGTFKQERIKRRLRRKAKQIAREFKCHHKDCQKLYGSETSLKNHLKLKHGRRLIARTLN